MYQRYILSNGAQVICEKIPYVQSISIGIWIKAGSRNESNINNGVSHFIEHMLFKGTEKRSARQIAEEMDGIGGQLNAFTGKELTCYYAKVLNSHLPIALDILSDMILHSKFHEEELEKERGVILEEINMYEDSPEDQVHDLFSQMVLSNHSLGFSILGTKESLHKLNRNEILEYYLQNYIPSNAVIAVVGNFNELELIEELEKYFGNWKNKEITSNKIKVPQFSKNNIVKNKETEQVHLCLGMEGLSQEDEGLYPLLVLNNILGGGMSSRLFQRIREENGLAYSIFSYPSVYSDIGLFNIYTGTNIAQLEKVIYHIMDELKTVVSKGISNRELSQSKEQLKGNYILGLESTSSRMNSIGKSQLLLNKVLTPNEIIEKIDTVYMKDIQEVIDRVFKKTQLNFTAIGNIEENDILKYLK